MFSGVAVLVEGMNKKDVITKLRVIDYAGRGTLCSDQLALALEQTN